MSKVKCAVCKQPAIPLYVEQVNMSSKIARLDVVDSSDHVIGSIDMKSSDMTLKSKSTLEAKFFPVFDLVESSRPTKICFSKHLIHDDKHIANDHVEWLE
jgi:hypothetical protein